LEPLLPASGVLAEIGPAAGAFTGGVYLEFALGCSDDPDQLRFGRLFPAGYTGALGDMSLLCQIFTGFDRIARIAFVLYP
jgi:hypothetical protein